MKKIDFEILRKIDCVLIFLLGAFAIAAGCVHLFQGREKIREIYIPQNLDEGIVLFLSDSQAGNYEYPVLTLNGNIPKEKLFIVLDYYYLRMQTGMNNIRNKETTRTLDGLPYKRQWVQIDSDGKISIKESDDFRLVYDPSHPDAIKDNCPEKGYVRYPAVNIEWEAYDIKTAEDLYNIFVSYGNKVYPSVVFIS